ncbi:MAG: AMP-binding protein [Kofleriaceae bacterium]
MDDLGRAFSERVRVDPTALALFDRERSVTYAALEARSLELAGGLARRGVVAGDRIGLAVPRSIDLVATMLAAFRLGAVVVPIDPAWPAARRAMVERDAELACTVNAIADLDTSGERTAPATHPIALALYTSGSTGDPKAVLLGHAALSWRCHALAAAMPFEPGDIACHRTPPTFVDAYAELFAPLLHGIPTFVMPHPFAISDLVAAIASARITRLLVVPSVLALVLDACPELGAHAPALRLLATSGEPLPEALARRCRAAAPHTRLVNIYGSTEVAGDATYADVIDDVTIGRPLDGVTVRIVDERGAAVAPGAIGELVVSGPVLADGYWNRPELTAARFVRDAATRALSFRTGDLARALPDGRLVLAGRLDDQIKIGGVRVELGEIERALLAHPSVRAAAAACDNSSGRPRLVAAVVGDGELDVLREHLASALPEMARPARLVHVPAIPMTSHGKIDRRAVIATASVDAVVATGDDLVSRIARWFTEMTGQPAAAGDVFEAIGGDSLARLGLLVRLEQAGFHVERADLPVPLTPVSLAQQLATLERGPDPDLGADDGSVSDFQRVMVLESLANLGTAMWSDQLAYAIYGQLDRDRFASAWHEVVAAEPALRTAFAWRDGDVRRVVRDEVVVLVDHVDLHGLDGEAYRLRVLAEEWTRMSLTFALGAPPLFTLALLQGPESRSDLIFTYHHAILDGESARRVLRSVLARYAGTSRPSPRGQHRRRRRPIDARWRAMFAGHVPAADPVPPKATRMGDAVWRLFHRVIALRAWFAARRVRRRSTPIRGLLTAARLVPATYVGGDTTSQPLASSLTAAIRGWAAAHRTTPMAVWVTAFALHLARERRTRDVAFGIVASGRDARTADAIGMLANCLPLRVQLDGSATIAAAVAEVGRRLDLVEQLADTPLLELAAELDLDPRSFLDTQFISWGFPIDPTWTPPDDLQIRGGRGITLTAPTTALIVSGAGAGELAVGARAFHRTDRIRREVLTLVDAILDTPDAPVEHVLASPAHEGGLSIALPEL